MTVLYIIGNGFDIWHDLPTRYEHFYQYANDTMDNVERYFDPGDINKPWHDFENSLGTYSWKELFEQYDYTDISSDDFRVSETYGLHDELAERADELHNSITQCFVEWVENINVSDAHKKFVFKSQSRFITFNYTQVLQIVYGIDDAQIFHIHGKADCGDIIFGHGLELENEPEFDSNGDSNRTMFTDAENAAKYPLYAFKKPTKKIISDNKRYLDSLLGLNQIEVIGHSMADVDIPYIDEIAKRNIGITWVVYFYQESDREKFRRQLHKCGVETDLIVFREYPST